MNKRCPQSGGGSPALFIGPCSNRCWGFQACGRGCALKRKPAEVSRSRLAHARPSSAGKSPVYSDAPGSSSLSEHEVQSPPPAHPTSLGAPLPAAACTSPGSDAPPVGRRALYQLATHGIDCPRLPRLERVAFAVWLGRGARRLEDPPRVSLRGCPAGAASVPRVSSLVVAASFTPPPPPPSAWSLRGWQGDRRKLSLLAPPILGFGSRTHLSH